MKRIFTMEDANGKESIYEIPQDNDGLFIDVPHLARRLVIALVVVSIVITLGIWAFWKYLCK